MARKRDIEQTDNDTKSERVTKLRKDIQTLMDEMKRIEGEENGPKGNYGEEALHSHWEDMQKVFNEARKHGDAFLKRVTGEIEQHPVRSAAVAFGIGFLVAKIFAGRRS